MKKKNVSSLSDHLLDKKKGIVSTPLNYGLKDQLSLNSWAKERMPEYLWLGLILLNLGRKNGIETAGRILYEISQKMSSLTFPRLSLIFNLENSDQKIIYEIIANYIEKKFLSPLTILYKSKDYPLFNEYFYIHEFTVEDKLSVISKAIKTYYPHQSNEATDLRFLSLALLVFGEKLHITKDAETTAKAFKEYPYTDHEAV